MPEDESGANTVTNKKMNEIKQFSWVAQRKIFSAFPRRAL